MCVCFFNFRAYFDKLNILKGALEELDAKTHIEYIEGMDKLQQDLTTRYYTKNCFL